MVGIQILCKICAKFPIMAICEFIGKNVALYYNSDVTTIVMKLLTESVRNFCEGFISFYATIYNGMKKW